ncbi:MAG: hypothetical protein J6334_06650 [Kiritimatiellae bacterium]|nr:hypothetical protein [Kiritimatiellia bacterium]
MRRERTSDCRLEARGTADGNRFRAVAALLIAVAGVVFAEAAAKPIRYSATRYLYDTTQGHRPVQIGANDTAGIRFSSKNRFDTLRVCCPSYSNNKGSLTLALYRWEGSVAASRTRPPIARERFVDFRDCAILALHFPEQTGTFYAELSEGEERVGVWIVEPATVDTASFFNGNPVSGTYEFAIGLTDVDQPIAGSGTLIAALSAPTLAPPEAPAGLSDASGALLPGSAFAERDLFADTWDAIDGLGRQLGNAETLPAPRAKQVGIFYWTWHEGGNVTHTPRNNAQLIAADPTLPDRPTDPAWGPLHQPHHWDEPLFGYYRTTDSWVSRRHAQLLAEAGIDTVVFDATNGTLTWMDSAWTLLRTWSAMRRDGIKTPRFAYMLPFWTNPNQAVSLLQLYRDIYKPGKFRELWYYWQGRPLVHANPSVIERVAQNPKTPAADRAELLETLRFFTFRPLQAAYTIGPEAPNQWCWLEAYPQHPYGPKRDGTFEMCGAGVAQNHSWKAVDGHAGLASMNDINVFGRAYMGPDESELRPSERLRFAPDRNPRKDEPNRFVWGDNFAQQMRRARAVDPDYLFITGWNEWIAGFHPIWQGKQGSFPDQYSPPFSRDIEPSAGILKDHFYYQLVQEVRQFRGVRPQRACNEGPVYRDAIRDTLPRNAQGYGGLHYTDTTGRNDLTECAVTHDDRTITFSVTCADPVTPHTDKAWMRLFISLSLEPDDPRPSWNHLHFVVNRLTPPDAQTAILERCEGGWRWRETARVPMAVTGKTLTLTIPREALGLTDRKLDLRFKWADNTPGEGGEGEILDLYRHGDTAPDGRFLYRYFER